MVVSDIFGKNEFLIDYQNIGLYEHLHFFFSKFLILMFPKYKDKYVQNVPLQPSCTNFWQMWLMIEGRVCLLAQRMTNVFNASRG